MRITIEISDDELIEEAKQVAIGRIADDIFKEYRSGGYCYRNAIKECVREVIKRDIDELSDRAIAAASKTIENRALKKMFDKALNESRGVKWNA